MSELAKKIGVLILNTGFPRIHGDIGNPSSFNYPTVYQTIDSATPATIVKKGAIEKSIQNDIQQAADLLTDRHVSVITTSCGFLAPMQAQLAKHTSVPVITSSLTLLPLVSACHGGTKNLGILTFDQQSLRTHHLGEWAPESIEGLTANDTLKRTIADDLPKLDREAALSEVLQASDRLTQRSPDLKAIILECTNLSPYKTEIRSHTGLPVYDIVDAVHWLLEAQPS